MIAIAPTQCCSASVRDPAGRSSVTGAVRGLLRHLRTKAGAFSFVLIDVHTRPERALREIDALADVFAWANVIARGTYASPAQLDALVARAGGHAGLSADSFCRPGGLAFLEVSVASLPIIDYAQMPTRRWLLELRQ